ncbi:helix-turn-helix domain-containing protein [Plebeiibacterium sediminum]|uniref:Helix-turn-helix domain-containing protein n=1 Tax=Plebeiibacterium sediminum TaxID=2992112 RepID=A0AAE3M6F8_9BACT|nr:helix-turn-helix transcriptional regulator [Plebeiobacterium sediminum]MCW3787851.1 helix-turn-helix domain-containing protein [Plebeiobacterium sediminum]
MKSRLQTLLTSEKITSSRFADIIGVNRSSISHILSGRNNPSLDILQKVLTKFPHINPDWLLLGQGNMLRNKTEEKQTLKQPFSTLFENKTVRTNSNIEPKTEPKKIFKEELPKQPEKIEEKPVEELSKPAIIDVDKAVTEKKLEKIVFFYSDKSFEVFHP